MQALRWLKGRRGAAQGAIMAMAMAAAATTSVDYGDGQPAFGSGSRSARAYLEPPEVGGGWTVHPQDRSLRAPARLRDVVISPASELPVRPGCIRSHSARFHHRAASRHGVTHLPFTTWRLQRPTGPVPRSLVTILLLRCWPWRPGSSNIGPFQVTLRMAGRWRPSRAMLMVTSPERAGDGAGADRAVGGQADGNGSSSVVEAPGLDGFAERV